MTVRLRVTQDTEFAVVGGDDHIGVRVVVRIANRRAEGAAICGDPTLLIGYSMILFDGKKRGLHDRRAGTLHLHAVQSHPAPT